MSIVTRRRERWLIAAVAAVAVAVTAAVPAEAEQLLIAGPAYPFPSNPLFDYIYDLQTIAIGSGYYPDADRAIVHYPAGVWPSSGLTAPTMGSGVSMGSQILAQAIRDADGPIVVTGLSEGAVVIDATQALLADDPTAPPADQVVFVVYGSAYHGNGILTHFPAGTYIPFFDVTVTRPVESQYDTIVVIGEYDGVADFPDRPWNLVALANSALAMIFVHTPSAYTSPADVPAENITVTTNSRQATTTTYFLPARVLPLTQPLRLLGVPGFLVDQLDAVLRPVVDSAYVRHDPTPTGTAQTTQPAVSKTMPDKASEPSDTISAAAAEPVAVQEPAWPQAASGDTPRGKEPTGAGATRSTAAIVERSRTETDLAAQRATEPTPDNDVREQDEPAPQPDATTDPHPDVTDHLLSTTQRTSTPESAAREAAAASSDSGGPQTASASSSDSSEHQSH